MYISDSLYVKPFVVVPTIKFRDFTLSLVRGSDITLRLKNGEKRYIRGNDNHWAARLTPPVYSLSQSRDWRAALVQLSKRGKSFKLPTKTALGTNYSGAAPKVNGANQLGTSLECDGVTPLTDIAEAGAHITINTELKILTADATSDTSGAVTFQFEPPLRNAPPDNLAVEIDNPYMIAVLEQPVGGWNVAQPGIHSFELVVTEKF